MKFFRTLGLICGLSVLLIALSIDSAFAQSVSGKSSGKPLVVLSGIDTLITNEMCLLIREQEDWDELWQRHVGQKLNHPGSETRETVQIDFEKSMVIAVFGGNLVDCGGMVAYSLSEQPGKVVFRYKLEPHITALRFGNPPVPRSTYGFFVLPRTDKPVEVEQAVPQPEGQDYAFEPQARFEPRGHSFGIYLVEGDFDQRLTVRGEGDWSKLKLASNPIISKRDILSSNPTNYTIRITAEAAARIPQPPVIGKPFVMVVDGQKVFLGVFMTGISSFSSAVPTIRVDREAVPQPREARTLTIDRAYPTASFGKGPDPRSDERIRMSLR